MKETLKKYNILKKLSLVQQFIAVFLFIALVLFVFMMPLVDYNLRVIIDNQMYETLANEQEMIINSSYLPNKQSKRSFHMIYDRSTYSIISSNLPNHDAISQFYYYIFGEDLEKMIEASQDTPIYHKSDIDDETYYYAISKISNDKYLISVQDSNYSDELISSLRNQTIYIQYAFFLLLALILIIWVMSLINPLKKIKIYIDSIKERKPCELNIDREDEIGIVSKALVEMNKDLRKQEKIKEEMIHNISHDLKTPIALIQTYGQSIKDDIYPYGDKNSSMDVILENADRLEHKVKSLLYLNRLDYLSGENQELGTFDMKQLIEKIVLQMDLLKPELQLETELEDVCFIGDEEHWRVAIENIIENASRYAHTKIKIILKDKYLEIYNDGEHIDEQTIPDLFNPYVKGVKGQFGLGLSIVQKIMKMFGYQVTAINKDIGVSFIITKKG